MSHPRLAKAAAVAGACACVGAGAGVLGSASADNGSGGQANAAAGKGAHQKHHGRHLGAGALRRAVHADAVVPDGKGGFARATIDRGFVTSVSGDRLTLREGTRRATYQTVTLTIPASARVRDDGRQAKLADVKPGQHAVVLRLPRGTVVRAHDTHRK